MGSNFYINEIFFVEPDANSVTKQSTGIKSHLEARLIQVLTILAENHGKTVTREELITAIWQDYGGGDEGLTQAISILRKVFADTQKQLIQTVHKKGYVLNAVIKYEMERAEAKRDDKISIFNTKKRWTAVLLAVLLICCAFIIYYKNSPKESIHSTSTKVPYPVNIEQEEQAEENAANTISTQGPDSTFYKLVIIEDRPPKFYINNRRIAEGEWEPYMPLINSLKKKLAERRKAMQ